MRRRLLILLAALVVGGVFAAGLFIHGRVGGALLLVVDAVLIAMAQLTWKHLKPQGRPLRVVVIAVVGVLGLVKLIHG